ncbi:unnamed protein product [Arabidopsis thaliana]|uniref:(thale cress) hypothetical protein n=1 Tax=Arabidopsis thaliana TaxID=3702 RepID=A0A7G2ENQ4_ARATH|nr:unnamed protein product [Arabidopsis thaliana]
MISKFGSVHILAVVAIQLLIIPSISSLNLTNAYLHHKCNNTEGKYSHGSAFEKYINLALRAIDSDNYLNGFAYIERGEDPNKVFVMYQCRGDSYGSKCKSCISAAISGIDYENDFYLSNPNDVNDKELFNKETSALLEELTNKATDKNNMIGNKFVLYAAGDKRIGTKNVYAMVQCTKDLVTTTFAACFEWIFKMFSKCCEGKQGGRVLGTSCNFRYELYPFLRN